MYLKPAFSTWFVAASVMTFLVGVKAQPLPGGSLNPLAIPKYVEPLVIPPVLYDDNGSAMPFEIAMRQFDQQVLPSSGCIFAQGVDPSIECGGDDGDKFPSTTLWGYGDPHRDETFFNPSFTIEVTKDTETTVKWINDLVDGAGNHLQHILQDRDGNPIIDQTLHWAAPNGNCKDINKDKDCVGSTNVTYTGPVPMTVHVHGSHVGPGSDGYPESWWLPAGIDEAEFELVGTYYESATDECEPRDGCAVDKYTNDQPTTTLWYHDHALGITRLNVYAAGAGFWLIRTEDDGETGLMNGKLPGPAPKLGENPNDPDDPDTRNKIREIPIAIQPRSFNDNGSLFYPADRAFFEGIGDGDVFGANVGLGIPFIPEPNSDIHAVWNPEAFFNTMVVNGRTWPYLDVAPELYRFRLLNAADSRFLNLALKYGDVLDKEIPFYLIGSDQSLSTDVVRISTGSATKLPGGVPIQVHANQTLLMGPAERMDVIVDFSEVPSGTDIIMTNTAPDAPFGGFPDEPADESTTGQVMKFRVRRQDTASNPWDLDLDDNPGGAAKLADSTIDATQDLALLEEVSSLIEDPFVPGEPFGPKAAVLGVDGSMGGMTQLWNAPIAQNPGLDTVEQWELWNWTEDSHPIHLHLVKFQVVGRALITTGAPGSLMEPQPSELGWKDTVIAYPGEVTYIRAKFDIPGLYVWHCHILSHEDNEMMVPYCVGLPGKDCPSELFDIPASTAPSAGPSSDPSSEPSLEPSGMPSSSPSVPTMPAPTPCVPGIIKFLVWDADEDKATQTVIDEDNMEVCFPDAETSIEAVASDCTDGVELELKYHPDGNTERKTESNPPYMLFGDSRDQIFGRRIPPGEYTISAYPDRDSTKELSYDFTVNYDCN